MAIRKDSLWWLKYKLNLKFEKELPCNVHSRERERRKGFGMLEKTNRKSPVYLIRRSEREDGMKWGWKLNWELDPPVPNLDNIEIIGDFDK